MDTYLFIDRYGVDIKGSALHNFMQMGRGVYILTKFARSQIKVLLNQISEKRSQFENIYGAYDDVQKNNSVDIFDNVNL